MLKRESLEKVFQFLEERNDETSFRKGVVFSNIEILLLERKKAVNYSMIFNGDFYYRINELTQ